MDVAATTDLLYRIIESERLLLAVHRAALPCVTDARLRYVWAGRADGRNSRWSLIRDVFAAMELDPDAPAIGRLAASQVFQSWIDLLSLANQIAAPATAQRFAVETVLLAETHCLHAWHSLTDVAATADGLVGSILRDACRRVDACADRRASAETWLRDNVIARLGADTPAMTRRARL